MKKLVRMATPNRHTNDHASHGAARPQHVSKDLELEEDQTVVDDDVSDFFDEQDSEPGDRRRDPLRHSVD